MLGLTRAGKKRGVVVVMNIDDKQILELVNEARRGRVRPCVEAVPIYEGWYLSFESGRRNGEIFKGRTRKFKLPGGGIKQGQTPSDALAAEFLEEIGVDIGSGSGKGILGMLPHFSVLAIGQMSTSRPGWSAKLRIVTTLELPHTDFELNGEIVRPRRFRQASHLLDQVGCCVYTSPGAASLYSKAIRALETDLGYLTQ